MYKSLEQDLISDIQINDCLVNMKDIKENCTNLNALRAPKQSKEE